MYIEQRSVACRPGGTVVRDKVKVDTSKLVVFLFLIQTKQHFREYMEDFNTCTLPHEKYIDLEKWEMAEYNRKYHTSKAAAARQQQ